MFISENEINSLINGAFFLALVLYLIKLCKAPYPCSFVQSFYAGRDDVWDILNFANRDEDWTWS